MTPGLPLPDPLPQPASAWLLWTLLQLTFPLHLLAMNLVLGGAMLALGLRLTRAEANAAERALVLRALERALPSALAATITLGVAPLLFVQVLYGRVFFVSSMLMGWYWLALVPLLIAAYYGAYALAARGGSRRLWALVTALLTGVAFLQVTNAGRALRVSTFVAAFRRDGRGLTLNLDDPSFWPRCLHVLLGALAVASLALALAGARRWLPDQAAARWALRRGTALFALATIANVFVGVLFLISLPRAVLIRLVGGDARAMTVLSSAILLAVALAGAALLAPGARNAARATLTLVALTLVGLGSMLLLREELRRVSLQQAGFVAAAWVAPQWGPFTAFVVCLLGAAAAIGWMLRALARGRQAEGGADGAGQGVSR